MKLSEAIKVSENLIEEGKIEEAHRLLNGFQSRGEKSSELFNQLGITNYLLNNYKNAIVFFKKAIEENNTNESAVLNLSEIYLSNSLFTEAVEILTDFLAVEPGNEEARLLLKKIEKDGNNQSQAIISKFREFESYFPTTFIVETALACNLKCPECAIGDGSVSRKKGFLKFDDFKILADKVRPYAKYFYLHLWGEPMLNKEIIKMIKYASEFTRVNISTNGTMLDENLARELILSGVTDIIVSIDGMTQEVYEKYRVGGNLEKAKNTLQNLVRFNNEYSANVNIMPQFIVFKHNQHEMGKFSEFCSSLGLKANFKAPYFRHEDSQFEISDYEEYRRPEFETLEDLKSAMSECVNPRDVFTVQLNGDVILCCHDYDRKTLYGNLFEQDVEEIWNNPKYRLDRWKIIKGKAIDFCVENCMTYIPSKKLKSQINIKKLNLQKKEKNETPELKVNLCSGPVMLKGWVNVDISPMADITIDLEKELLPFEDNSVDTLVCISAINYFTLQRGFEIIKDVYRVMKDDGIVRFATQDLRILAEKYLNRDEEFFFQKLENGQERFPGITFADKFSQWFYGFETGGKTCKYVYDYETLSLLFKQAGFEIVEEKKYMESEIPEIKLIDNRPEQMFFLEARKKAQSKTKGKINQENAEAENSSVNFTLEYLNNLLASGEDEKAWQIILQHLEKEVWDKDIFLLAIKITTENKRYEELIKLTEKYINLFGEDDEIEKIKNEAVEKLLKIKKEKEEKRKDTAQLLKIDELTGEKLNYEEHLSAAICWLKQAFDVNKRKGVSAAYNFIDDEWMVSYPETTGYIIPTFIAYSEITGNNDFLIDAIEMGDWEIDLQWENGGIGEPPGVYGLKPRVFNTAQVMLGFLSIYNKTEKSEYLQAAIEAGNWLVEIQNEDGSWTSNTYQGSKTYHSRVAWVLAMLYEETGDNRYLQSAEKFLDWVFAKAETNGWFSDTSLTEPDKPWTHLFGYTIYGLLELMDSEIQKKYKDKIEKILFAASERIVELINLMNKKYLGLPGEFTPDFSPEYNWTCLTGNAQIEIFLRKLGIKLNEDKYILSADKLLDETKSAQYLKTNDKNIYGGLGGSFPINGGYSPFTIPNWAVKFLADSLILKINNNISSKYLG